MFTWSFKWKYLFLKDYIDVCRGCFQEVDFQQNWKQAKRIPTYLFWQGIEPTFCFKGIFVLLYFCCCWSLIKWHFLYRISMLVSTAAWQSTALADGSSIPMAACSVQDHTDHKSWSVSIISISNLGQSGQRLMQF